MVLWARFKADPGALSGAGYPTDTASHSCLRYRRIVRRAKALLSVCSGAELFLRVDCFAAGRSQGEPQSQEAHDQLRYTG